MVGRIRDARERRPSAVRTFLIADIRGYTRFTAELGDEAGSRLATKFAQVMAEGIEAWGGTLVELRGDEALCVFDSARQALRAAVELQDAFADETRAEPHLPLTVGIGLDAGEAVPVGDGYRGAALNLAARLCSVAAVGEIRATDGLVHLTGPIDGLTYVAIEPAEFKNVKGSVATVRVESAHGRPEPASPSPTADNAQPALPAALDSIVPLAGRQADRLWLSWHWRRARHGHGRAVAISGPRGMGKTRLLAEVAAGAHEQGATVTYLAGSDGSDPLAFEAMRTLTLVIVDDAEKAPNRVTGPPARLSSMLDGRPVLLVVAHSDSAPEAALRGLSTLTHDERRREIGPLDQEAIAVIAALYADPALEAVPLQLILEESDGVPIAVHRVASQWARGAAARRLGESAHRTASERRDLRIAEADLIGEVANLEMARERTRLYVAVDDVDESSSTRITICPYKGLAAFEAADAEYYFGRERLVAELIARIVGTSFVGLVGASGSGKSSVLQAGLLPGLAGGMLPGSDDWIQVVMRPGEHPDRELRNALRRDLPGRPAVSIDPRRSLDTVLDERGSTQRVLLVIDQFEELFTTTADEAERAAFIDLISEPWSRLKVLVAVRADHYERCAAYPALAALIGANHVLAGPLTVAEIEAIIRHPAERVGLRVEQQLVESLVADVGVEPGGLPLLSTALLELWEAREAHRLTLAAYRAAGGVRGAVARMAEVAYARLDEPQQAVARAIFLRLASLGEGATAVRRRATLDELDAGRNSTVARVLDKLIAARLLTASDGHVEVAHEALLREWPRLRDWIDEDAAGRQMRLHMIVAAREWDAGGREDGDLYRGARLAATLDWSSEHAVELNETERVFVDASKAAAERDADDQRRRNRRLKILLAGAGVFLLAAVAAGGLAAFQLGRAEEEAARAETEAARAEEEAGRAEHEEAAARTAEALARSRELAASAIAVLDDDPSLSKLLALAAVSIADPPVQSVSALHQALAADRVIARYAWPGEREVFELWTDLHPSGQLLVASGAGNGPAPYLEVFDLAAERVTWSWEAPPGTAIQAPVFSADGSVIFAGIFWESSVDVTSREEAREYLGVLGWDTETGAILHHFDLGPCGGFVQGVADAQLLVRTLSDDLPGCFPDAADASVTVELLTLSSGLREALATTVGVLPVAMNADGSVVAYPEEGDVIVLDLETRERAILSTSDHVDQQMDGYVRALNHDGSLLLYGGRPIMVWDVATGEVAGSFDGHAGESWFADFGPTGRTVYSTGRDGSLRHWDIDGEELDFVPGIGSGSVSSSADGRVLVANTESGTANVVDLGTRAEVSAIGTCDGFATSFSLQVVHPFAVFQEQCGDDPSLTTHVMHLDDGELVYSLTGGEGQTLSVSPDGRFFARQEGDGDLTGQVKVRALATGDEVLTLEGLCTWSWREVDAGARRIDAGECSPFPTQPFALYIWQMKWSPDGSMIAAADNGGFDGFLVIWDAATGRILHARARDEGRDGDIGWGPNDFMFTADSSALILAYGGTGARQALSTQTWEITAEVAEGLDLSGGGFLGLAGVNPDGDLLAVGGFAGAGAGALHWLDATSLEAIEGRSLPQIHDGSVKSLTMSADRSLVATGGADGFVRVWDSITRTLVHEIPIGATQVQGLAFIDETRLAVVPEAGSLYVYTIDTNEVLEIARLSLTRGFTETECGRFNFGEDCPTLEELRVEG